MAVALFLVGAVVLTAIQIALQLRGDVKKRAVSDEKHSRPVMLRIRRARYVNWWALGIGLTIGTILHANKEDTLGWAPEWFRDNAVSNWTFPGYDVVTVVGLAAFFLAGLVEYRWYMLNGFKIDEKGIEVCWQEYWRDSMSSFWPGFRNTILTIDWSGIKTIWFGDDGGLYAEVPLLLRSIAGAKLPKSAMPTPDGRTYRLLTAKEVIYPVELDEALVRWGGQKYANTIPGGTATEASPPVRAVVPRPVKRTRGIRRPGS